MNIIIINIIILLSRKKETLSILELTFNFETNLDVDSVRKSAKVSAPYTNVTSYLEGSQTHQYINECSWSIGQVL